MLTICKTRKHIIDTGLNGEYNNCVGQSGKMRERIKEMFALSLFAAFTYFFFSLSFFGFERFWRVYKADDKGLL